MTKNKILSLFSGVGGLDLGLEAAGLSIDLAIDYDSSAVETYQRNFPGTKVINRDISQIDIAELKSSISSPTIIAGGCPCQGFSKMGYRNPDDPRNNLLNHFFRLVNEFKPIAFILENVPEILHSRYQNRLTSLFEESRNLGYKIACWQLNALDYGVPQHRKRVFLTGSLFGFIDPPKPTKRHNIYEAIADLFPLEPYLSLTQDSQLLPEPTCYTQYLNNHFALDKPIKRLTGCLLTKHRLEVIHRFTNTEPGSKEPISRLPRLRVTGYSSTLKAGGNPKSRHTAARPIHPCYPRVITVREAARLSSFPDYFQFASSKLAAHRQIGNAVPPLLGYAVAKQICSHLEESSFIIKTKTERDKS